MYLHCTALIVLKVIILIKNNFSFVHQQLDLGPFSTDLSPLKMIPTLASLQE
jgi:hypothetical protein